MNSHFETTSWSLTLPHGWSGRLDAECATLEGTPPLGALQLSVAWKESAVDDADLRGFASEHLDAGARTREVTYGPFSGFVLAFGTPSAYWKHWYLRNDRQMLFATYGCEPQHRGVEDPLLERILVTLRAA